jgi:outer membrane immunogenic protein
MQSKNGLRLVKSGLLRASLAAAVGLAAACASAHAADLSYKGPSFGGPAAGLPPLIDGWAGFYVGGHGGGGWSNETTDPFAVSTTGANGSVITNCALNTPPCPALDGARGSGALYGGQFGYNWQPYARWVTGIEADISGASINGSSTVTGAVGINTFTDTLQSKIRDIGSVRGKVGFLVWDNVLFYGTGGLAFGQVSNTLTDTTVSGIGTAVFSFSNASTQFGWSAGAGADWKFGNLILGALYLHYDLGSVDQALIANGFTLGGLVSSTTFTAVLPNAHVTVDAVTVRASWLFR